jgi:3-hydroxyisobutyrate dehydrogenase
MSREVLCGVSPVHNVYDIHTDMLGRFLRPGLAPFQASRLSHGLQASSSAWSHSFSSSSSSSGSKGSVGFIGLGNMGGHMASNLLHAGYDVSVFDVMDANVNRLTGLGATAASSPKDLASRVQTIVTMLPSSPHVREVYLDSSEALVHAATADHFFLDCSTIDPGTAQLVATGMLARAQASMVDAPVSGGVGGAEQGTLTFMVGGSEAEFAQANPFLTVMGSNIVHCGASGTGQVAKICNNLVLAISMTAVSEAMNIGVKSGADPKVLAGIINTSSGRCWSSDTYNPVPGVMEGLPSSRDYTGGFGVDLMKKDIGLALQAAEDVGQASPTGKLVWGLYDEISKGGQGLKDFGFMYEHLKESHI